MKRILLLTTVLPLFLLGGCYFGSFERIEGEGPMIKRTLDLHRFNGIVVQNAADVYIKHGQKFEVEVEGQRNILDLLSTDIIGQVWKIRYEKPVWHTKKLKVWITMPEITLIRVSGSGDISGSGRFDRVDHLEVNISGSGSVDLNVDADDIEGVISGSGNIRLDGKADRVEFRVSGSGDIYAMDMKAKNGEVKISGSGGVRLYITDYLDARISGSGDITYEGQPRINAHASGSGHINSR